jgi:Fe-S-cluster containining protein
LVGLTKSIHIQTSGENMSDNKKPEISEEDVSTKKEKFVCKKGFNSCEKRGPIPIVFSDLEFWAGKGVLDNFMGHLRIDKNEKNLFELVMVPVKFESSLNKKPEEEKADEVKPEGENKDIDQVPDESDNKENDDEEEKTQDIDKVRCPMFNLQQRACLVYDYLPLACKAYPLEYDGEDYLTVDSESPKKGEGDCSKEDRIEMKNNAEKIFNESSMMRISIPVLFHVVQKEITPSLKQMAKQEVLIEMMMEQQKAMQKMSPEELEELKKVQEKFAQTQDNKKETPIDGSDSEKKTD